MSVSNSEKNYQVPYGSYRVLLYKDRVYPYHLNEIQLKIKYPYVEPVVRYYSECKEILVTFYGKASMQ